MTPPTPPSKSRSGRVLGGVLSAVFLLMGGGMVVPFFVVPMVRVWQARGWNRAGCVIESSRVRGDGETFAVDVRYRYQVNGASYTGTRARFLGGASSGREAKQRVIDRLVPGTTVPCWVDPRRPDQSVLDRGLNGDFWFAVIPGLFALLGALGLYGSIRGRGLPLPARPVDGLPAEARVGPEPRPLAAEISPRLRALAFIVVALFWNGVTQFLVRDVIDGWRWGHRPIFLTVFAVLFVAAGAAFVVVAIRHLLALSNPRPRLTIRPGRLVAGGRAHIDWELTGNIDRVRRLTVTLEGREESARGEDSWDTSVFASHPILEEDLQGSTRQGSAGFEVPAGARPSFAAARSRVVWVLKVHGEIPGWPDFEEKFPVGVLAAETDR